MADTRAGMSISVLLPDLRPGGAERMRVRLAGQWLKLGHQVEFVLLRRRGELLAELPGGATVVALGADRMRSSLRPLVRYLRRSRTDALLAAMWPLTVLAPVAARLAGYRGRVVISEHSPLSRAYASHGYMHSLVMRSSMRVAYSRADVRIGVSSAVADDMAVLSGLPRNKFTVVHNPAASGMVGHQALPRPALLHGVKRPLILGVGTLKAVKRHDLLIDAFSRVPADLGAILCILGEGPEREALEQKIATLGLSGRVLLPGFAADTEPWYASADVFVLSSDYEGFGNVIVEALEHGLPVVSTDCPGGASEILAGGKFGHLVPTGDVVALADAMRLALVNPGDSEARKARARDFSLPQIAKEYLALLSQTSSGGIA